MCNYALINQICVYFGTLDQIHRYNSFIQSKILNHTNRIRISIGIDFLKSS